MHQYERQWPDDRSDWSPPSPTDFTYRDARDVARYAASNSLTTWCTWPDIWHLDVGGNWHCCSQGSTLDSVQRFAEAPRRLLDCRAMPTGDRCPDHWVVIEPRHPYLLQTYDVTEADVEAFLVLRQSLATLGVNLLDVLVVHQDYRWWSLHELTTGTTAWDFDPAALRLDDAERS